jgi:hypothetical protein
MNSACYDCFMASLALIYPAINAEDFDMIQSIRKQHDTKYFDIVSPHITLVFGTEKLTAEELTTHVRENLHGFKPFKLSFDTAKLVEDDTKQFHHAFLIPSSGYEEIREIHDILYTGEMESELRHDIPFIPHLGIGTGSRADMERLVDSLNGQALVITGMATEATIVQYDGKKVIDLYSVTL